MVAAALLTLAMAGKTTGALSQEAPNEAIMLPPNPAIQLCEPTPTNCFNTNKSLAFGIAEDGATLAGENSIGGGAPAPTYFPTTATIFKNGQWHNIGPQVTAAVGVVDGSSFSRGISGDGSVVVGLAPNGHVFRWVFTGPGVAQGSVFILPKGTFDSVGVAVAPNFNFGGTRIDASMPISNDGSTIVGSAESAGNHSAFRCVGNCTGLQLLPPLLIGGQNFALGTNGAGTIVVGTSQDVGGLYSAFYWSSGSGSVSMGRPVGLTGNAIAYGSNLTGTTFVGSVQDVPGGLDQATIWNRTGPVGTPTFTAASIHGLALGPQSVAKVISGDGQVVGGASSNGAFRWTAATGSERLEDVLAAAGVVAGPFGLADVTGISFLGDFMAVNGVDPDTGNQRAYLLRYIAPVGPPEEVVAPPPGPASAPVAPARPSVPIVGITTRESVQRSFDRLAETRTSQMVTTRILSSVLLGINEQVNCGDCFSGFGSAGSFSAGLHGRRSITDSLIAMGGVSINQSHGKGYKSEASPTFALQFRLDPADWGPARPFLDVGGMIAPNAVTKYSRRYQNGIGPALGRGSAQSSTAMAFARGGYVWRLSKEQEAAVYGEFAHMMQRIKGYSEPLSQANPFEASVRKGTDEMSIVKVGGQFTQLLAANWELNLSGGIAHGFNRKTQTAGTVPGFGLVTAAKPKDTTWLEYGARVSYRVSQTFVIDGFVNGTASGSRSVGNSIHGGFGIRLAF
jgi:uncharacterized membrane protein